MQAIESRERAGSAGFEPRVIDPVEVRGQIRARMQKVLRVVRRIIGVPDYDTYVEYVCEHNPGATPLSRKEFERERMTAKYTRPGSRCC